MSSQFRTEDRGGRRRAATSSLVRVSGWDQEDPVEALRFE